MPRPTGHLRTAVVSAGATVLVLVGGWSWAADLVGPGYDARTESISALASLETPHRWVMTLALLLTGAGHVVTATALGGARSRGRLVLAAGGVATALVALVPLPSRTGSTLVHTSVATLSLVLLAAWPLLAADPDGPPVLRPRVARPAAVVLLAAVASLALTVGAPAGEGWFGLHERVVAALTALWPVVTAVGVWWSAGRRVGSRRVRQSLGTVLLTLACVAAGVAATAALPATAQTRTYQATVSLDASPGRAGELVAETTFGDVEVAFSGLAPGIRAVPQVKANIADLLSRPNISLAGLRPGPEELNAAIRDVAVGVLARFAAGALLLALVVVGSWALARRRRPPRALVVCALLAWIVATLGTAASLYTTYQPERQRSFTATQVLGTLQRNQGLLDDVETRASQVTPYLRNLLALSTALQQKYAGGALEAEPALRVLFVSDIHGGNQYPLMRTIVEDQSIDLVVDTGDLVNFGTVQEGEAAGIFSGIESLGVPYLFVRGNHDATSASDTALLRRMARVPNVVLLEPADGGYQEVTVAGLTLAGFNDPRYFGDSGTGTREAQVPAREAFEAAFADLAAPDVVASHEPWALEGVEGGVLLNGHMHSTDLEGNRVQVGTFTGGGPFAHFVAGEAEGGGAELEGQGSSFDILTFGTDCRLSSLTRYRFHDVIEGRPSYDDVAIVNGSGIDTRPAEEGRTCEPGGEPVVTTVPAAS
ncbi:DUF998 domain-containing protein [Phycicoccus endophyticus]|uniref:DUF998 domain-containing protein n=1 Tax=Phycicoccus endophyticus TaxID=1690220 RepID=A0A7G9R0D2_9MICO|nr:DUF998 domain-containing protein [Phycicoccus endophyticus]NHI20130.1 DUF998 domain-containing protein [Phycicoccus endophyticus]QNN49057.1 DUF998 domain-containing protein [Phycicoccus endophyticus]GGL38154.1 hypothetical protein GCM10012283_20930 [Phycicoccus endophyticus]